MILIANMQRVLEILWYEEFLMYFELNCVQYGTVILK
jgi:hypothetical protein